MIATLLLTMMMALGVATGNVSSNVYKGGNAFNTELKEKPNLPIKKSSTNINDTAVPYVIAELNNPNVPSTRSYKFYMADDYNTQPTANYSTGYYNMYNTTYTYGINTSNTTFQVYLITLIKITPYFNFNYQNTDLSQQCGFYTQDNSNVLIVLEKLAWQPTDDIEQYIDMTLTDSTPNILTTWWRNSWANGINKSAVQVYRNTTNEYESPEFNNSIRINGMAEDNNYYAVLMSVATISINSQYASSNLTPYEFTITGQAIIPEINYEVVDIPGVMFKVLVMPFSFISTAFNLTVFPGTPYALNFGNLFLTILAIFILMWLIKKVFNR